MLETMGIYVMGVIFGLAVLAKMISYITVRKMVKAASEIQKSNHKLMKLIKAKFEHASMVSDKVQNVSAFVDKYLYEYRFLRIKLWSYQNFPRNAAWIISLIGSLCVITCYRKGGMSLDTLLYIEWTCLLVFGLILIHYVFEEETRIKAAKNYIVEYLENVCVHRYEKANLENRLEEVKEPDIEKPVVEEPEQRKKSDQEIRIRAILEEFMA